MQIFVNSKRNIRCFARANGYRSQSSFLFSSIPGVVDLIVCTFVLFYEKYVYTFLISFFSNFFFFFHIYQIYQKYTKITNFFHRLYKIYGNESKKWICIKINNLATRLIGQLPKIQRKNRRPITRDILKLIQHRSRSVRLEFPWTLIKQRELLLNIQMPDKDLNQRVIRAVQQIDTRQNIRNEWAASSWTRLPCICPLVPSSGSY